MGERESVTAGRTIAFGDSNQEHVVGNADCSVGWCGTKQYPKPCDNQGCTGLVHANFGDENSDGDYWLYTQCDVCGEKME